MTEEGKILRRAEAIFNFLLKKQQSDKRIGELRMQDFLEICLFLSEVETEMENANN